MYEYSCGAVVFMRVGDAVRYVLVVAPDGVVGLPKGHIEADETERETALREIGEETGLEARLLDGFAHSIEYASPVKPNVTKRVTFFVAEHVSGMPTVPVAELAGVLVLPYAQAAKAVTHADVRRVLEAADRFVCEKITKN